MSLKNKIILIFIVSAFIIGAVKPAPIFGQTQTGLTLPEQNQLQEQLQALQDQIQQYQQQLKQITGQKNTLQNKINVLKKQEALLQLQIQQTTLEVNQLSTQIASTMIRLPKIIQPLIMYAIRFLRLCDH